MPTVQQIETALIQAIRNNPTLASYVLTVEGYQGNIQDLVTKSTHLLPGIFVMFSGSRAEAETLGGGVDKTLWFTLIVAARDLRGEYEARTKTGGIYAMLADLEALLLGNDLGMDIVGLTPVREEPLFISKTASVWGARYETRVVVEPV